ncbi:MAG: hypothetical protein IKR09_01820 [Alphaproteobacteria bacterium]|nr:hypothetical protein [Alphaproteobacteria bacterium]
MPETPSFEDRFDHDPNAVYEKENEDFDLGPDDEFADLPSSHQKPEHSGRHDRPKGGCLGGILKTMLSLSLIAFCYFYIFHPEKFTDLKAKIQEMTAKNETAPLSPAIEKEQPVMDFSSPAIRQKKAARAIPQITLHGSGLLADFTTAAKQTPSLNDYLLSADKITFETLDSHHALVKNMIAGWAQEKNEQKIAQIVQMPYEQFFKRISASLLSQTLLKHSGMTPVDSERLVMQSPVHVMAALYPKLRDAMATKKTVQEQIRTIEPASSFLIYICHDDSECMASWDLLIDMLGAKKFAKRLEKAPETIYVEK